MAAILPFVVSGLAFGLSAGLAPGPLLTLVITETLKHGARSGIKVAIAPLLTDLPIVCASLFLLSGLSNIRPVLGGIALCGAAFLIYLGTESIRFDGVDLDTADTASDAVRKGVLANFLNPSPYLFWISIGGPLMMRAMAAGRAPAAAFIAAFYLLLVGSKVVLAWGVGRSRRFLKSTHYVFTVRLLGVVLYGFALLFLWDGLQYLGIVKATGSG